MNRISYKLYLHYMRLKHINGNKGYTNFLDKEWDYAIVLDSCRYDIFKQYNDINGKLSKIISPGSHTIDWIKKCMIKPYQNTILLSSSPHFSPQKLKQYKVDKCFYKIQPLWDYRYDDELETIPPNNFKEPFYVTKQLNPDKRIILWLMQPHRPFINGDTSWSDYHRLKDEKGQDATQKTIDKSIHGYINNLNIALLTIKSLLPKMKGKVIITADHGNLFGEYGIFLHPRMIYVPELVEVPYLEIEND